MAILKWALYLSVFAAVGAGLGVRSVRAQGCDVSWNNWGDVMGRYCYPAPMCGQATDQCEQDTCGCYDVEYGVILYCMGSWKCGSWPGCLVGCP
jgi:hypothetical protein